MAPAGSWTVRRVRTPSRWLERHSSARLCGSNTAPAGSTIFRVAALCSPVIWAVPPLTFHLVPGQEGFFHGERSGIERKLIDQGDAAGIGIELKLALGFGQGRQIISALEVDRHGLDGCFAFYVQKSGRGTACARQILGRETGARRRCAARCARSSCRRCSGSASRGNTACCTCPARGRTAGFRRSDCK